MEWKLFWLGILIGILAGVLFASRRSSPTTDTPTDKQIRAWQQILHQAPVGYLQVDEENHLFFCNYQARNLLGITLDLELGETSGDRKLLLQIIRSYELDQLIQETRTTKTALQKSWIFHPIVIDPIHPVEKEDIPIRAYSIALRQGHIGIFIEDRQETTTLANQRDRWAADIAHDLKTPLTSIRLIAESLQPQVTPNLSHWLETIVNQTIRLTDLVQDILDVGQVEMGMPLKLNLEIVDIPAVIQNAWQNLELIASAKNIKLEYWGASNLTMEADESKIYRVLLNLLDNSIKHSPPLKIISIKVEVVLVKDLFLHPAKPPLEFSPQFKGQAKNAELVVIELIDSGSGFAKTALPFIFDRFYQSDPPELDPNSQSGSGLGLAIARQIVKSHKGTIIVGNHPETGGAWVKVSLPKSQN